MAWEADVYQGDVLVARFERSLSGSRLVFTGDAPAEPGYLAWNIPYSQESLISEGDNLPAFFLNLLPEGARLDLLVRKAARVAPDDFLGILLEVGWETVGDIAVVPHGQTPESAAATTAPLRPDEADFWEMFYRGTDPASADSSIPGVQEKVSDRGLLVSVTSLKGSRAMLKLNPEAYPRLVQNEHFFLQMADGCGLQVNRSELVADKKGQPGLLVQRFDREKAGRNRFTKLHQEDACQLLNTAPSRKYRINLTQVADAFLEVCTAPAVEITRLIQLTAFSYLIGNGDLHAKNISLLWREGSIQLSPAYDLLSTLPYPLDPKMALKMLGWQDRFTARKFAAFGARYDIPGRAVTTLLSELTERAVPWLDRLGEIGFDEAATERLHREISNRLKALRP